MEPTQALSTFQAIVYGIVHGFSEFLPIASEAHQNFVAFFLGWPQPSAAARGALELGSFLAVLIYFRHDWASMVSSVLQLLIYRKKPMTLDERLPFFLLLTTLPTIAAWFYLREAATHWGGTVMWTAILLAVWGVPLWFSESMNRKTKGTFDLNVVDALVFGVFQGLLIFSGIGRMAGAFTGGMVRNYRLEACAKYVFFAATPLLAAGAYYELRDVSIHAAMPTEGMSWFTFLTMAVVTFFSGLLSIGGFMKQMQCKGLGGYLVYRVILGASVIVVLWLRFHSFAASLG